MSQLWGGRFEGRPDPRFHAFQASLSVDQRLWREDIAGSIAWAHALARAEVILTDEARTIEAGLCAIAAELEAQPALFAQSSAEDIHDFVESRLRSRIGDLARKLHTGRSRNDQVATDFRLNLRVLGAQIGLALEELQSALVQLAAKVADLPMPGYTHLQRAQPVTAGHFLLAYVEMLERDRERLQQALARMNVSPLGSGALAGTAFPVDREQLATELGFSRPTRNSLDAVSARDHAAELAFMAAQCMVHLSRFSEDCIFFASQEARFVRLSDAISTGSSLMPQKKNPDGFELLRGKSARVIGALQSLLVLQKGLPLAYDKDLQEDKELCFDALDTVGECLAVAAILVNNIAFDEARCRAEANKGYSNATDLADLLVRGGIPFRDAHERAGLVVRAAIERGIELDDLAAADRARLLPELVHLDDAAWRRELSVDAVLARRRVTGGTAPERVRAEAARWKALLHSRVPLAHVSAPVSRTSNPT